MLVEKLNGELHQFNPIRITNAILKASNSINKEIKDIASIIDKISAKLTGPVVTVAQIQDTVEYVLQCSSHKDIAKSYIMYRHDRDISRESKGKLLQNIEEFLKQENDELTKENANKDSKVVSTHRDLLAGIVSKHFTLRHILPKNLADAHTDGYIHIHDTDYFLSPLTNCQLVNYRDMLENGFKIGDAEIEKPKSITVASTILTQIIQSVASSQYGGQTIAHFDSGLAPFVELSHKKLLKEKEEFNLPDSWVEMKLRKEVYDAMQAFLYQVNTLTTTNGQTPFITISLGLDTTKYGRLITETYLQVHEKGLGKNNVTPVFPKVIFILEDSVNLKDTDINYDLKQKSINCSIKRIYPDYISAPLNRKITGSSSTVVTAMGCRSFLSKFTDETGSEKFDGRFNIGVVSLNLPMIAMEAKQNLEEFYIQLEKFAELAYDAQLIRVNRLLGTTARQNPTLFMYGAIARLSANETIDKLLYDGYASISIGFIGLSECCELLNEKNKEAAMKILQFLKNKCEEFKTRSRLSFSLYGTPSEGYALRSANCLKKKFGNIIDRDYLTNSFHQPVWENSSPVEKWNYEAGFAELSSGGHISYIEQPVLKNNRTAYESFIDLAYQIHPYFGINTPIDKCFKCNFEGEFIPTADGYTCPTCGNNEEGTISVIRRISGYLTAPNSRPVNAGKQQEIIQRVIHK